MLNTEKTSKWFKNYTEKFKKDGELPLALRLKVGHSARVSATCDAMRSSMQWNEPGDEWLAHSIGLLHDTGRFPQYEGWETFQDSASTDHGDLGAQILEEEFDWDGIPKKYKETILIAVKNHNKIEIAADIPLYTYRWAAMIRDADKIDIFHMVQERIDNGTIFDMLPRHKKYDGLTPALVEQIRQEERGSYTNAKSLQDYRLIQLTWGCDLNYPVSVATLKADGVFERICGDLKPYGIDDLVSELMVKINSNK